MRIAIQADPFAILDAEHETTLLLAAEALRRGHGVYHYTPDTLSLDDKGRVAAHARSLTRKGNTWQHGELEKIGLNDMSAILIRQDPPFDMSYITATYILETLHPKPLVVNAPRMVRDYPEKLFPLQFPAFVPPTLVSANPGDIRAFHREQGEIVIKPLYLYESRSVFHVSKEGENLSAIIDALLGQMNVPMIAQRFLPEIRTGERRATIIDGQVGGIYARIPDKGQIRAAVNASAGGRAEAGELTPRQRKIAEEVAGVLREKDIIFAGLDLIGDYLTEINITSPGGFHRLQEFYGTTPAGDFWDAVERRV